MICPVEKDVHNHLERERLAEAKEEWIVERMQELITGAEPVMGISRRNMMIEWMDCSDYGEACNLEEALISDDDSILANAFRASYAKYHKRPLRQQAELDFDEMQAAAAEEKAADEAWEAEHGNR